MTKTAVLAIENRRKEALKWLALLLTAFAVFLVNAPTSHAGAMVESRENVEWFSLGPYNTCLVTSNYEDLRAELLKEHRLVATTTVIKHFKDQHSTYHELLSTNERIMLKDYIPKERVVYYTYSQDQAEKFIYNMKEEEPGWWNIKTIALTANDLVIVVFER